MSEQTYGMAIFAQHAQMLAESGITPEHAQSRGYRSVDTKSHLESVGITRAGRNVPGLLVHTQLLKDGSTWGFQYRPDQPRTNGNGKPVKYETPVGQRNGIDVPPGVGPQLGDPKIPLFITEGIKKADAAALAGICCVALPGVWSWLGKNPQSGKVAVPDWLDIALNDRRVVLAFDSDVVVKLSVHQALAKLAGYLASKGASVAYLHLPNDDAGKTGLDDFLADGHTAADLWKLVRPDPPEVLESEPEPPSEKDNAPLARNNVTSTAPMTLARAHDVFTRWLGNDYDLDALDATLAAAAVERLDGDPIWLLVISRSGNAKTETVQALDGIHATGSHEEELVAKDEADAARCGTQTGARPSRKDRRRTTPGVSPGWSAFSHRDCRTNLIARLATYLFAPMRVNGNRQTQGLAVGESRLSLRSDIDRRLCGFRRR